MIRSIKKILIANRGEIARRIMRTVHQMGISSIAVYSDSDVSEPFVDEADYAYSLDGQTAADSYLNTKKILAIARASGADAIHPGYGFLSENTEFAQSVVDAGLVWVGPPPKAIAIMGDKLSSKRLMNTIGVMTLPAIELTAATDTHAAATKVGYPLLVKASAGGGGKGMRVVTDPVDLNAAIESARRESGAAFGNDTIFLEKWLESARHIEIQILADRRGNIIHCFERECSIQRRHQKIIEESPSPAIDEETRDRMGKAAIKAAQAVDYESAGTVEFLYHDDEFWFLEMNTRLQVEHPVTELVTGLDLVREQLLIAQGFPFSVRQADLDISGHSIEARLYAEDPDNQFLPSTGKVLRWKPATGWARFDAGIETNSSVTIDFDPLLAKVITHAPSRTEAALTLAKSLENTRIQGLTTNRDFLIATLRHKTFLEGDTTTDFIERVEPYDNCHITDLELQEAAIATALYKQCLAREAPSVLGSLPSGWRNSKMPPERIGFHFQKVPLLVAYRRERDGHFKCEIDKCIFHVQVLKHDADSVHIEIVKKHLSFYITYEKPYRWWIHSATYSILLEETPRFANTTVTTTPGALTAPMPGRVISTHVNDGQYVEEGDLLMIIEAMKMEHRVLAPKKGIVNLKVGEAQQVSNGELLVVINKS